jgi:hypothetical protein
MKFSLIILFIVNTTNLFSQVIVEDTLVNKSEYFKIIGQAFDALGLIEKNDIKGLTKLLKNSNNASLYTIII